MSKSPYKSDCDISTHHLTEYIDSEHTAHNHVLDSVDVQHQHWAVGDEMKTPSVAEVTPGPVMSPSDIKLSTGGNILNRYHVQLGVWDYYVDATSSKDAASVVYNDSKCRRCELMTVKSGESSILYKGVYRKSNKKTVKELYK